MSPSETSPLLRANENDIVASRGHHLATSRAIVYQLTSIVSAVDGVCGTLALATLRSKEILASSEGATIDYTSAWVAGVLLTAAGSLAGAAAGIMFLVMMLHPGHHETPGRVLAKEAVFAVFSTFFLVASILSTVVLAKGSATLYTPGWTPERRADLIVRLGGSLAYRDSLPALLFVILGWTCWLFLTLSLVVVSLAGRHVLRDGPEVTAPKGVVERLADRHLSWLFNMDLDRARSRE